MLTAEQLAALQEAARAAVACERATQLPAELTIAQWAIESAWGSRCPGNNCFGIKVDAHGTGAQYVMTQEFLNGTYKHVLLAFEKYASIADCFLDHARLITQGVPYQPAWQRFLANRDVDWLIDSVAAVYATGPLYAASVHDIASEAPVIAALKAARATAT